jgi:hypothetical protein
MTTQQKRSKVDEIEAKLEALAKLQQEQSDSQVLLDALVEQVFTKHPKLNKQRQKLLEEQKLTDDLIQDQVTIVKDAVLTLGESVKSESLQAVWSKGKTSWDSAQLEGLAKVHKEILETKKTGNPSVSIKKVKS